MGLLGQLHSILMGNYGPLPISKNTIQGHGIELGNFNMGLLGLYQDVLTPKEFVPEGVQLTQKLELFWSTDQRLEVAIKLGITIDDITTKILIGTNKDFPHKLSVSICLAVCGFIAQTMDKVKI